MKATTPTPNEHPPLARDPQGHHLPIPEGTCAWRICRHTKGRPRVINGPDKQPARFPLDMTAEELADACGADSYRVYALDDVGKKLLVQGGAEPIRLSGAEDAKFRKAAAAVTENKLKEMEGKGLPARQAFALIKSLSEKHAKTSRNFWR